MKWKQVAITVALVAVLAAAPFSKADAHWRRGPFWWPFWAGAAVVGTAAAIATAPLRVAAAPYYPYYYYPPRRYYYRPYYYYGYYPAPYGYYGY